MSPSRSERFVVTGARGCVGARVVRCLLDDGSPLEPALCPHVRVASAYMGTQSEGLGVVG